jgi:phosphoribosylformimino-5-aminoimidazole carboxamide ribotide isomerase
MSEKLGAKSLFSRQDLWPDNIIIMTLTRVGSCLGPDLAKLNEFCSHYPDKQFIAAGGIRNTNDLHAIRLLGVNQALVASALHSGTIIREDIQNL